MIQNRRQPSEGKISQANPLTNKVVKVQKKTDVNSVFPRKEAGKNSASRSQAIAKPLEPNPAYMTNSKSIYKRRDDKYNNRYTLFMHSFYHKSEPK